MPEPRDFHVYVEYQVGWYSDDLMSGNKRINGEGCCKTHRTEEGARKCGERRLRRYLRESHNTDMAEKIVHGHQMRRLADNESADDGRVAGTL